MSRSLVEEIRESVRTALDQLATSGGYQAYIGEQGDALANDLSRLHAGAGVLLTSSGTAALEIALRAANIGAGDEVLLSSYDYPGNFWAIERVGARPVILDVAPNGWNVNLELLEHALSLPNAIRAVVVSHLHGQLQPMEQLHSWCHQHGLFLVEDACQALGALVNGRPTGTSGRVGIASFGGGKVLSAGRGGCLFTHNDELLLRARLAAGSGSGPYAMSELQSAVVASQLKWLPEINATCFNYFQQLIGRLEAMDNPLLRHVCPASALVNPKMELPEQTTFYQCGWLLAPGVGGLERTRFVEHLKQSGLHIGAGFPGFHRRSSRRCRIIPPKQHATTLGNPPHTATDAAHGAMGLLPHAAAAAERTWVIHHRQALDGNWQVDDTAALINAATRLIAT